MKRVEDFYGSACETKRRIKSLVHDKNRPLVLRKAVATMCAELKKESETGAILSKLNQMLKSEYEPKWFDLDWQMEQQVMDDTACFGRFLKWLNGAKVLEANIRCDLPAAGLSSRADLVVKRSDGALCAMIIHFKKADKSPGGKAADTSTKKDLFMLVTKAVLEEKYPGIQTALVYLVNDEDGAGCIGDFKVLNTRKSNAFFERWTSLYEDGVFMREYTLSLIKDIASKPPVPDCYSCSNKDLCCKDTVSNIQHIPPASMSRDKAVYKMPAFTKTQQQVVFFKDGPMLVCAGPGSGKTATLVGRVKQLIDSGIDPELILLITFTRDAAGELLRRCSSFCRADEHPEILTLNALGYKLLRNNEELLGRKINLLSQLDRYRLIQNLLSDMPRMAGFSYAVLKGKKGLIATLDRRIEEYRADPQEYRRKHPECDAAFAAFVQAFTSAVEAGGYISFDEQISLALELLSSHPETAAGLSRRYSYIMVDEYQDVNEDQVRFVYALARHRNLVCVGDDDQSIYGFRGGSNRYMLSFGRDFPDARRVVLSENFRSGGALVEEAQTFIAGNKNRIKKDVHSVRERGYEPKVLHGRNAANIDQCVKALVKQGFGMRDIAVLASKNATLEDLSREVTFKSVLGKAYLRDNPVFKVILYVLSIHFDGADDKTVLSLLTTMDAPIPEGISFKELISGTCSVDGNKPLSVIRTALARLKSGCSPLYLTDYICQSLGMDDTAVEEALDLMIEKNHLMSCAACYAHMQNMVDFEDDTRIEPDCSDAVLFITSHESKGMEWRAVIMCDDYKEDGQEETNRLYYVAMTRAKDMLYILTEGETLLNLKKGGKAA